MANDGVRMSAAVKRAGLLGLSVAALLLLAPFAGAQVERIEVTGTVTSPDGKVMPGAHVMVFDGHRSVPPFMVRPKSFGLPLPNIRVVRTDAQGRFEVSRVAHGPTTVLVGEESLLLFGTAAARYIDAEDGLHVTIKLSEEEFEAYGTIGERSERTQETVETVLVEVDTALGWYVQFRERVEDFQDDVRERLGLEEEEEEDEGTEGQPRAPKMVEALRRQIRGMLNGE